ncbi:MAG: hypothetical protein A3F18_04845 [Legionellales bacterium RIFCSPHIGHO2_12_FULL_37_14]|nr:MAG: hypothetical protein A3F18_04845 [Legionellales bacterium RIFCSPHIGHO2_12_FULL_37_14]
MKISEIALVLIVAILVLKPQEWLSIARFLGRLFSDINNIKQKINSWLNTAIQTEKLEKNLAKAEKAEKEYRSSP